MEYAVATLKKGEGRALKAGGAWIYDNEIESVMGHFEDGDLVLVRDFDGYGLGKGFINRHSKIRIRMMTRNPVSYTHLNRKFRWNPLLHKNIIALRRRILRSRILTYFGTGNFPAYQVY